MSAKNLATETAMPMRLISESLVNLLRAGWVELRASAAGNVFAATTAGTAAAAKPMPDYFLETQPRSAQVYMDRISGEFFAIKELTVVRRDAPSFRPDEVVEANLFNASPYGPELIYMLPLGRDDSFERLREAPRIIPGELFAELELSSSGISGLPTRTPASVGVSILDALRAGLATDTPPKNDLPSIEAVFGPPLLERGLGVPVTFSPNTLVMGGPDHLAAAELAIRNARRLVVIHSTFVGKNIAALIPALRDAAAAGVHVHVHWGRTDDPEGLVANPSELAANLARTNIPQEHRGNFFIGTRSTGSHAKIILADTGDENGYCALLGSCNWLDSPYESVEASVLLTDAVAIALVAGKLASLIVPAVGQELIVSRLLDIHGECVVQPQPRTKHTAMLVTDEDHYTAVRDAMRETSAGGAVLLGSHKFGHAGETTVFDPMREAARHGANVKLFYTKVLPNLGHSAATSKEVELAAASVELRQAGEAMHAKFIAWGEKLLITSFNFLSASTNGRNRSGAEIGVLLSGPGVVEAFENKLLDLNVLSELKSNNPLNTHRRKRRRRKKTAAALG
jgi:hypothetical protein